MHSLNGGLITYHRPTRRTPCRRPDTTSPRSRSTTPFELFTFVGGEDLRDPDHHPRGDDDPGGEGDPDAESPAGSRFPSGATAKTQPPGLPTPSEVEVPRERPRPAPPKRARRALPASALLGARCEPCPVGSRRSSPTASPGSSRRSRSGGRSTGALRTALQSCGRRTAAGSSRRSYVDGAPALRDPLGFGFPDAVTGKRARRSRTLGADPPPHRNPVPQRRPKRPHERHSRAAFPAKTRRPGCSPNRDLQRLNRDYRQLMDRLVKSGSTGRPSGGSSIRSSPSSRAINRFERGVRV